MVNLVKLASRLFQLKTPTYALAKVRRLKLFQIPFIILFSSLKWWFGRFQFIIYIYLYSYKNTIVSRRLILLSSGDIWDAYADSEQKTW